MKIIDNDLGIVIGGFPEVSKGRVAYIGKYDLIYLSEDISDVDRWANIIHVYLGYNDRQRRDFMASDIVPDEMKDVFKLLNKVIRIRRKRGIAV